MPAVAMVIAAVKDPPVLFDTSARAVSWIYVEAAAVDEHTLAKMWAKELPPGLMLMTMTMISNRLGAT